MFAVSGSEANERSMQIARHYWIAKGKPEKHKVISFHGGYHGATMGTYAICGLPHLSAPYDVIKPTGFAKVTAPYPFRDRGAGSDEELVERRARELREAILKEGPETVSAVIQEPVLSSGGFIMPPIGWLGRVRAICDELDVLLIADEVITGFGRTGRWFAVEHDRVVPDLMSVAKGITSGYVPLSASIARRRLAEVFADDTKEENVHPNTYAAHPVACAAALANLQIMEKDHLVENAEAMGERLVAGLRDALKGTRIVGEVRGRGLLVCAELVQPNGAGPLDKDQVAKLDRKAWDRWTRRSDPEGGFAPLPAVVARLTACSFLPPPRARLRGQSPRSIPHLNGSRRDRHLHDFALAIASHLSKRSRTRLSDVRVAARQAPDLAPRYEASKRPSTASTRTSVGRGLRSATSAPASFAVVRTSKPSHVPPPVIAMMRGAGFRCRSARMSCSPLASGMNMSTMTTSGERAAHAVSASDTVVAVRTECPRLTSTSS
jgi:acetylornithine/succinyldiaminopimelate/putrescine aminotransferase